MPTRSNPSARAFALVARASAAPTRSWKGAEVTGVASMILYSGPYHVVAATPESMKQASRSDERGRATPIARLNRTEACDGHDALRWVGRPRNHTSMGVLNACGKRALRKEIVRNLDEVTREVKVFPPAARGVLRSFVRLRLPVRAAGQGRPCEKRGGQPTHRLMILLPLRPIAGRLDEAVGGDEHYNERLAHEARDDSPAKPEPHQGVNQHGQAGPYPRRIAFKLREAEPDDGANNQDDEVQRVHGAQWVGHDRGFQPRLARHAPGGEGVVIWAY